MRLVLVALLLLLFVACQKAPVEFEPFYMRLTIISPFSESSVVVFKDGRAEYSWNNSLTEEEGKEKSEGHSELFRTAQTLAFENGFLQMENGRIEDMKPNEIIVDASTYVIVMKLAPPPPGGDAFYYTVSCYRPVCTPGFLEIKDYIQSNIGFDMLEIGS